MALAGEGARSDAIDDRRRRGSVTSTVTTLFWVFLLLWPAPGLYTSQGPGPYEDGAPCGRCVGCGIRRSCIDPFLDRSHSRNIIRGRTQPRSSPTNYNRGRVTVNRVEHRALGLAVACTVTVLAQLISDTWVPSWGPLLTSCGLVQRHRSPHNRMPRVPLALPVASYLSPPIVSSGSARLLARQHRVVARPQPHACGRLVPRWPGRWAPCIRALSRTQGHNMFPPPSSLESASVSVAAVTSTVAYAGAGCT